LFLSRKPVYQSRDHESDYNSDNEGMDVECDDAFAASDDGASKHASVIGAEVSDDEDNATEAEEKTSGEPRGVGTVTRSVSKPPARFRETGLFMTRSEDLFVKSRREVQELSMINISIPKGDKLTHAEEAFLDDIPEVRVASIHDPTEVGCATQLETTFVSIGISSGFGTTQELHVLDYKDAILSHNHREWEEAIYEEHECTLQHGVLIPSGVGRSCL
jgi:hypothetical protein